MGLIGTAVKVGILAKVVQVAQRELSKPENRQKIANALNAAKSKAQASGR